MKKFFTQRLHPLLLTATLATVVCSGFAIGGEVRDPTWQSAGTACVKDGIGNVRMGHDGVLEQCRSMGWVPLAPVSESPQAKEAKEFVTAYLGKLFTIVDQPVMTGDTAAVHATVLGQSCDLILIRHPDQVDPVQPVMRLAYWIVQKQSCVKTH